MKILLKIRSNGEFLTLTTTDREHGKSRNFLVNAPRLREWLEENKEATFFDEDLGNYLQVYRFNAEKVTLRFAWLTSPDYKGNLHGYKQTMIVPVEELRNALNGFRIRFLSDPDLICKAHLMFSERAHRQIAKVIADPMRKRALSKALRDNFNWRDTEKVEISPDWGNDFYFRCDDGMCGGLILHHGNRNGHESIAYTIHT